MSAARDAEQVAYDRGVADTLALVETVGNVVSTLLPPPGTRLTLSEFGDRVALHGLDNLSTLRPYDRREAISLKEAADIAGRSESAVREWITRFAIGRNVVGSTMVSRPALLALLDGDTLALAALLSGRRDHPALRPYLERAGLKIVA